MNCTYLDFFLHPFLFHPLIRFDIPLLWAPKMLRSSHSSPQLHNEFNVTARLGFQKRPYETKLPQAGLLFSKEICRVWFP